MVRILQDYIEHQVDDKVMANTVQNLPSILPRWKKAITTVSSLNANTWDTPTGCLKGWTGATDPSPLHSDPLQGHWQSLGTPGAVEWK